MIEKIKNTEGVIAFAKQIVKEGVSFHPDDDFMDYVNFKSKQPVYTKEEADFRNELMQQCFEVCDRSGVDIYCVMNEVLMQETGLDKFVLLPSAA